ncbi:KaiC domain-containing protein [Thermus hydrothermalis]|uniref:KaiC domain-containing protein n=1 Tax=Thermus hydrothermalis TaxID=2908148 RepID=UPI001FAAC918|nr:KaiC domain-containing protein [Thermus hydrothermalis]
MQKPKLQSALELAAKAPPLIGVPTGVKGLDELFFTLDPTTLKPKPLGGFPQGAAVHVTGISDTGKSLLAEQFALKQAERGETVLFVTTETPASLLVQGLKLRARAMGLKEKVLENVLIADAATYTALREDLQALFATLEEGLAQNARHLVVDSLTGLYEAKEIAARQVVRQVYAFSKRHDLTAVMISQKRSGHEELSAEAAGGYAVSHILDATVVLAKLLVMSPAQAKLYRMPLGEVVRFLRIDGCRLSGHDTRTHYLYIRPEGLLEVGPPLGN